MESAMISFAPRELSVQSFTGRRGQTKRSDLASSAREASGALLVTLLCSLPSEISTQVFLFGDLSDSYHLAGVACRTLNAAIWEQPSFWVARGGPVMVEALHEPPASTAIQVRGDFRRWVFNIQGDWSQSLEQLAACAPPVEALQEILDLVEGLRCGDALLPEMWRLVRAAMNAMQRTSDLDEEAQDVAASLVSKCHTRRDLFGTSQLAELASAIGAVQERALQRRLDSAASLDDPLDPWALELEFPNMKQSQDPVGAHAGRCLSLAFLAVMEGNDGD